MTEVLIYPRMAEYEGHPKTPAIVAATFKHSRGDPGLQKLMFGFLVANNKDKGSNKLTMYGVMRALDKLRDSGGNYIYGSGQHPGLEVHKYKVHTSIFEIIDDQLTEQKKDFTDVLTGPIEIDDDFKTETLASLVATDGWWIPYLDPEHELTSYYSAPPKYKSNFVHHGILNRGTGVPEINDFYKTLTDHYYKMEDPSQIDSEYFSVQQVVAAHLSYNPDDAVLISQAIQARQAQAS